MIKNVAMTTETTDGIAKAIKNELKNTKIFFK